MPTYGVYVGVILRTLQAHTYYKWREVVGTWSLLPVSRSMIVISEKTSQAFWRFGGEPGPGALPVGSRVCYGTRRGADRCARANARGIDMAVVSYVVVSDSENRRLKEMPICCPSLFPPVAPAKAIPFWTNRYRLAQSGKAPFSMVVPSLMSSTLACLASML
jgi:hypothetical protein